MPGGWTYQPYVTNYESYIFYTALGEQPNYYFQPVAVAKQVVNGTNYRYIAIAKPVDENGKYHFALVEITKPLAGSAFVTSINPIDLK